MAVPMLSGPKLNAGPAQRTRSRNPLLASGRAARALLAALAHGAQAIAAPGHRPAGTGCGSLSPGSIGVILGSDISVRYIGAQVLLELAILGLLKEQDLHGYELKKRLTDTLGLFSGVSFGSLYPALARLESARAVKAVEAKAAPAKPIPLTGSLTGELAAFRALSPGRRAATRPTRGKK